MKFNAYAFLPAAALLVAASATFAQTAAPAARALTKEQLRACVVNETEIGAMSKKVQGDQKANKEEKAAIETTAEQMTKDAAAIGDDAEKGKQFNAVVKGHNERVEANKAKVAANGKDIDALNARVIAHNKDCVVGVSFSKADREDILKELAAKK